MDFTAAKEYITSRLVNELSRDLFYHGPHHTFEVVKAATFLAVNEGISKSDYNLLITAAYFHDSGFLFQYKSNEPNAVQLVQEVLPTFDYSEEEVLAVSKMILATQSHIEPISLLEKIMCDADHDYIGTKKYHMTAKTLRKELATQGTVYKNMEWVKVQHTYLTTKHKYYTETAKKNRVPHKEIVIAELLEKMQASDLVK
jgi:HD superfamily phosphodiesterase